MASGNKPSPEGNAPNPNDRLLPEWMDPNGQFGRLEILLLQAAEGSTLPKNPFVIGKTIEDAVGEIASANTEARGERYVLKVRNHRQFEKLLQLTQLFDGTKILVIPHPTLNTVKCKVSCLEAIDLSEDILKEELAKQGVVAVRRITRFTEEGRKNTPTLILTFNGTVAPTHVKFGPLRVQTATYYPTPLICYNCFAYGHPKKSCPNQPVCKNCSQEHTETTDTCIAYCKNCSENHSPTSKSCPVYIKENTILRMKTEKNCSLGEARREYEKTKGSSSYASKLQERLDALKNETAKDEEIKKLKNEVEKLKSIAKEIVTIKAENIKLRENYKKKLEEIIVLQKNEQNPNNHKTGTKAKPASLNLQQKSSSKRTNNTISPPNTPTGSQPPGKKSTSYKGDSYTDYTELQRSENDYDIGTGDNQISDEEMFSTEDNYPILS